MTRVAVYTIIRAEKIIYIGVSKQPDTREAAHRTKRRFRGRWYLNVISWHRSMAIAQRVEARLIRKHEPPYNKRGLSGRIKLLDRHKAVELLNSGLSTRQVANRLGCDPSAFSYGFDRMGGTWSVR